MTAPQKLATPAEVAERLGISTWTLAKMRRDGQGPRAVAVSPRRYRYAWNDVTAYLVACRARSDGRP